MASFLAMTTGGWPVFSDKSIKVLWVNLNIGKGIYFFKVSPTGGDLEGAKAPSGSVLNRSARLSVFPSAIFEGRFAAIGFWAAPHASRRQYK